MKVLSLKIILCAVIVFAAALQQGCASGGKAREEAKEAEKVFLTDEDTIHDIFTNYRIVPGDILDVLYHIHSLDEKTSFKLETDFTVTVKFSSAPELNETQTVRPDGSISLPYVGNIYVVGKTVKELTDELREKYSKILQIPDVYVLVPDFRVRIKELEANLRTAPRGLSRLTTVRSDGFATFPMLGDVFVVRQTLPEANKILNDMYHEKLPGLGVDLFLEKNSGYLVYIVGDVVHPGPYPIIKPQTIIECLALAGGYQYSATLSSVYVLRKSQGKIYSMRVNVKDMLNARNGEQGKGLLYVLPDDIVYVPKRFITEVAQVANDIRNMVFFSGWSMGFGWQIYSAPSTSVTKTLTGP